MHDFTRLHTETFLCGSEHHAEIGSTNDRAMALCVNSELPVPFLVLADRQTSGRGRGNHRWWSTDGALLFSVIIDAVEYGLPESRWPQVSLTAGASVCEALAQFVDGSLREPSSALAECGLHFGLKWPNDVWLNGRKVCGILVEVPPVQRGRLVIGIGLNVNNSLAAAPPELHFLATSLRDELGTEQDREPLLAVLLRQLDDDLQQLASNNGSLLERWKSRCVLTGREVTLDLGQRTATGRCLGIADDGALRLLLSTGEQRFHGGTVQRIDD